MKYENARLTQMLAAEYALGTLVGRARQRFARLLQTRADLRRELQFWEARFAPLLAGSKPIPPREIVWAEIEARLQRATVTPLKTPANTTPRSLWLWQSWAVAASAALVVVSLQFYRVTHEAPPPVPVETAQRQGPAFVTMLQTQEGGALWLVSINQQQSEISVLARGDYPLDAKAESLELWVIGGDGKPLPLGLLPTKGRASMPMPGGLKMPDKPLLAISREPYGGSPTGLPTGPVISSGPLVSL